MLLGWTLAVLAAAFPPADALLAELIAESLAARPELRRAEALARASREAVPQAASFPDPVVALGIQNDGFDRIAIGEMETSFVSIMVTQSFPWPGKRALRSDVAQADADAAAASIARVRFSTEADVRRAYLALLLSRERIGLLSELGDLWEKSEALARVRYESGAGAQSDLLRAQLERLRLEQRRWALDAEARTAAHELNRLRGAPLEAAIDPPALLLSLAEPVLTATAAAEVEALSASPEIAAARCARARAERRVALADREAYPDLSVSLGVMPRGGLEPMWTAGVAVNVPIFSAQKQARAAGESAAVAEAESAGFDALAQLLRLRIAERRAVFTSYLRSARLFREGLLVQSQATSESALAQYAAGKVTFASVLEAHAGYLADRERYLETVGEMHRIAIADGELSLEPTRAGGGGGMAPASFPGAGSAAAAPRSSAGAGAAEAAPASSSMGGM